VLLELSIRDLALIEGAELPFGEGLNVLTGETGAGKSLLVGALELVLGETPRGGAKRWVRQGAREARVEARFAVEVEAAARVRDFLLAELPALVESWDESCEAGEAELVLGRTLEAGGRTRAHVLQRPVPRRALRGVAALVLEIHGQNDHQHLLDPAEQRRLLDDFGGAEAAAGHYRTAREAWSALDERARRADEEQAQRRERVEYLRWQRDELAALEPRAGEVGELEEERELLRHATDLRADLGGAVQALAEMDDSVLDRLRGVTRTLDRWRASLPSVASALEELAGAEVHLEEASGALRSLADGIEDDPARLDVVEERLGEYERLARKHGVDAGDLEERHVAFDRELNELDAAERADETLADDLAAAQATLTKAAAALTRKRKAAGPRLAQAVCASLAALGLEAARLEVELRPRGTDDEGAGARFGPGGAEDVELLLAANPGEPAAPLRHAASGGEAARIMLALRTVLQATDAGRTLVFDEIDAGVGGRLGPEVGAHLASLARRHQVLCVTHLPAIAASADVHLHASKDVRGGRTRTRLEHLDGDRRVAEVADMIAGGADEATARAEARRLLGV
jgi:DNA repair protein RecN (Recombination protein N)